MEIFWFASSEELERELVGSAGATPDKVMVSFTKRATAFDDAQQTEENQEHGSQKDEQMAELVLSVVEPRNETEQEIG